MNIFIIVVTYNGRKWYDKCFGSLRTSSIPVKIVVIDNASTDDTVSYIKANYPEIYLFESSKNLGFGRANNIGLEYALNQGCDYVYLLNQDAWVEPETLEILINVSQKNPDYGIISPIQVTANGDKLDKNFEYCCDCQCCPDFINDLYFNTRKEIYKIHFIMAAHWLISRKCLMTVGGFSPVFPHYGEDDNFIARAKYHGFKCGISPYTQGIHDREFRKITMQREMYLLHIQFIIQSSDINNSKKRMIHHIFELSRSMLLSSYKNKSITPVKNFLKWLLMIPKIIKYKKMTRESKAPFLTLIDS
ncbi:MAG: glycosyltransferase family 2 protein [Dysgonamonadaceae bacterium]|jgi:GT2 family glycosyltransferase|nr:glycosyltransferase family 2 protein [Dysgonamonadaceae bacterium]